MAVDPRPVSVSGSRHGGSWRLTAVVVGFSLVAVALVARLGGSPAEPVADPPALAVAPTPSPSPSPETFPDGIPLRVEGEHVYRVRDALTLPIGRTVLVGGWRLERECHARALRQCPAPTMADVRLDTPGSGDLSTWWITLDEPLGAEGASVLRGTIERDPRCSIRRHGECQPRLRVSQGVWPGDS